VFEEVKRLMPEPEPPRPPEPASTTDPPGASLEAACRDRSEAADSPTVRTRGVGSSTSSVAPGGRSLLPGPGDRLDIFELQEAIGVGGMGAVFKAYDVRLHRLVALKLLPPEQSADVEVLQRFYQEAQAAAQLDHENIARVYSIGGDQNLHYIAFEYIEGTTIRQRVERNGPLPVSEAINYTLQIAGALVHATERGVVHRDIKPSNIIVTPQGRAKLVDMGLARRFEREGDSGLTQSGMTLGTFDYISPEQARDPRDVDVRSDLYSLGCTLFHMLTGRPPFPEGTVLQKLLQHQEDAPPDVRLLNTAVPSELAAILVKLMAKDRDRRYQTPELLMRDLLTMAGALGLRSISPEGLVWMSPAPRPAWERHLVWGLPTAALALVVGVLLFWSPDSGSPPLPVVPEPPGSLETTGPSIPPPAPRGSNGLAATGSSPAAPEPGRTPTGSPPISPGRFPVGSEEDLAKVLIEAPAGSTIVLTDNGPYDFRSLAPDQDAALLLVQRDLTIKAELGVRPLLRLIREGDPDEGRAVSALLQFWGGRVVLEGLDFLVDPGVRAEPLSAILAEDTDLTVRRCRFHRAGSRASDIRVAALQVRATLREGQNGGRPAPVLLDACFFGRGEVGVLANGPVDVATRDCTFGASEPAFWFTNSDPDPLFPGVLRVSHASVLAGEGPVFRFSNGEFRVRVDDSVVAPPRDGEVTLVAAQDLDGLDWVGRDNLYAKIGTYLQPVRDPLDREPIHRFEAWSDAAAAPREIGTIASNSFVWAEADPLQALAQPNASRAFLLTSSPAPRPTAAVGARRGPVGPIAAESTLLATAAEAGLSERSTLPDLPTNRVEEPGPTRTATNKEEGVPEPMPLATTPMVRTGEDVETPLSPMPPIGRTETVPEANDRSPASPSGTGGTARGVDSVPAPPLVAGELGHAVVADAVGSKADTAPPVVRTASQFLDAVSRLGTRGGTVHVASDADLELPTSEIRGSGRWVIQAAPGRSRPRFRFLPSANPGAIEGRRPVSVPVLFRIRSGALQLQGIDLVLAQDRVPASGRWAAFGAYAGTEVSLTDCTVTIEGELPRSAVVVVQPNDSDIEAGVGASEPSAASVRVVDSLLRSGGDLIDVLPGRKLDLEITNSVVAASGALVHGHGLQRGQVVEPLKLVLRQVTARVAGGLVQLESAAGEPELPMADVVARDSILATTSDGAPLFRVDGQDNLDELRDRIHWEGHAVAYHQIGTYRRDKTAQIGTLPVRYDRPSWEVAVAHEDSPIHGDLRFVAEWDASRRPWTITPDDARLLPESPARACGPDLTRIPSPPRRTDY
jgi:eukaryotic-like serine/threonine-protein kinase